ncbi:MAG TPA: hypothetical protein VK009_17875 [Chloroflexota bacterium]|nr:hypothetical protein [Chloroflexota bacterium]
MRRTYVATEIGLEVLAEDGGEWRTERSTLQGKTVDAIVAADELGLVYAGVGHDGVYRTADAGQTWERTLEADVRSMVVDPDDPSTVYAGTEPVHLWRSRDAGRTWAELEGLQRVPEAVRERWWFPVYPHEPHVLSICVSPHDSRQIYVGLEHGGILRSDDDGATWKDVSAGIEYLDIHMVAADPKRQNLVYAATARGFYRSEDYGRDWLQYDAGFARDYMHDFIVLPGERSRLFMTTANGVPPNWLRDSRAESAIYRSDDEGLTWHQLGGGLPARMPLMVWNLVGDPLDEARLYAGAGEYVPNLPKGDPGRGELWASTDHGDTWTRLATLGGSVNKVCAAAA